MCVCACVCCSEHKQSHTRAGCRITGQVQGWTRCLQSVRSTYGHAVPHSPAPCCTSPVLLCSWTTGHITPSCLDMRLLFPAAPCTCRNRSIVVLVGAEPATSRCCFPRKLRRLSSPCFSAQRAWRPSQALASRAAVTLPPVMFQPADCG